MSQLTQPQTASTVTTTVRSNIQTRASTLLRRSRTEEITLKELLNHYHGKNLFKPEVQRKMVWTINGPKNKGPSFRRYLDHFFKHKRAIPIIVAEIDGKIVLVDGNNRTNAWLRFSLEPYRIYSDYFKNFEDTLKDIMEDEDLYNKIIEKISKLSFESIDTDFDSVIEENWDDEDVTVWWDDLAGGKGRRVKRAWKDVRESFNFSHGGHFQPMVDAKVTLLVYLNYTKEELMEIYRDINSSIGSMSEFDILAATLGAKKVPDAEFMINYVNIMNEIKTYYDNRNRKDELCEQFTVTDEWIPSLFSLLLGLQETMAKKYGLFTELNFTEAFDDTNKLPFIYKLWEIFDRPENENLSIMDKLIYFERKLELSCRRLKLIMDKMWPKLNKTQQESRKTIKDVFNTKKFDQRRLWKQESVQICLLLSILSSNNYANDTESENKIKRIIHYHFALKDWKYLTENQGYSKEEIKNNKDEKKIYQQFDWLFSSLPTIRANPKLYCKQIHQNPNIWLDNYVNREKFTELLHKLVDREIEKNKTTRNNESTAGQRRKPVSYISFTLMFSWWYRRVTQSINDDINENGGALHNDHMFPFSTRSEDEIQPTLDRLGNSCPIMGALNSGRGNSNVAYFWQQPDVKAILDLLNVYPTVNEYNQIIEYKTHGGQQVPYFKANTLIAYNKFCEENEKNYIDNFINSLYN